MLTVATILAGDADADTDVVGSLKGSAGDADVAKGSAVELNGSKDVWVVVRACLEDMMVFGLLNRSKDGLVAGSACLGDITEEGWVAAVVEAANGSNVSEALDAKGSNVFAGDLEGGALMVTLLGRVVDARRLGGSAAVEDVDGEEDDDADVKEARFSTG